MQYISTRDLDQKKISFTEALLEGLAPDGGLYCPEHYPQINIDHLKKSKSLFSYSE